MRAPKGESAQFILCEDVRVEQSGRFSLMGVFGPSIEVDAVPIVLPSLCVVVLVLNPEEWFENHRARVLGPDGRELVSSTIAAARPTEQGPYQSQWIWKMVPFPIVQPGEYQVQWLFDESGHVGFSRKLTVRVRPK